MRSHVRRHLLVALLVLVTTSPALGDEQSTARRFDDARRDEPSLTAFLKTMPKGGDLHHHFPAGMFAEEAVRVLSTRKVFVDLATGKLYPDDGPGRVAAERLITDDGVRYQFLNAASMRGPVTGPAGGHDHFFQTFGFIGNAMPDRDPATRLVEIVRRARIQNIHVRNSLEYSFLAGESLFEGRDYRRVRPAYRALKARGWVPAAAEERALAASDKAAVQARLERAFLDFER